VTAGAFLFFLISAARASISRWPATTAALVYTALTLFMLLLLPLFEGRPLLGPIYVPVDHFVPPDFPILIVVPALCLDLLMQRVRGRDWVLAALVGVTFVAVFLAVQWPFADFLMTRWARNRFFVSDQMQYSIGPMMQARWYRLNPPDDLARGLSIAVVIGFVSARCGLWWGNWMARVQR